MDENAIVEYLNRKDLQYKENAEEFMIRECMFCPKPHYNKADNLYKLLLDILAKRQEPLFVIVVVLVGPGLISNASRVISRVISPFKRLYHPTIR